MRAATHWSEWPQRPPPLHAPLTASVTVFELSGVYLIVLPLIGDSDSDCRIEGAGGESVYETDNVVGLGDDLKVATEDEQRRVTNPASWAEGRLTDVKARRAPREADMGERGRTLTSSSRPQQRFHERRFRLCTDKLKRVVHHDLRHAAHVILRGEIRRRPISTTSAVAWRFSSAA